MDLGDVEVTDDGGHVIATGQGSDEGHMVYVANVVDHALQVGAVYSVMDHTGRGWRNLTFAAFGVNNRAEFDSTQATTV